MTKAGFQPALIKDQWQVGQLNHSPFYDLNHFDGLIAHQKSARSLSLLKGKAILLTTNKLEGTEFEIMLLQRGTSYDIPRNKPHRIVMTKGTEIFVVEQSNQHLVEPKYHPLNAVLLKEIRQSIHQVLKP